MAVLPEIPQPDRKVTSHFLLTTYVLGSISRESLVDSRGSFHFLSLLPSSSLRYYEL